MVPRDLFNKMAALALVAIFLVDVLSLQAFAAETLYQDSGVGMADPEGPGGLNPWDRLRACHHPPRSDRSSSSGSFSGVQAKQGIPSDATRCAICSSQ